MVYVTSPSGASATVALNDGASVGGDPSGVYLQGVLGQNATPAPQDELWRQPADGSPIVAVAAPPVAGSGINETDFDYRTGQFPWFATQQGYVHLWEFKDPLDSADALWVQWAPLP